MRNFDWEAAFRRLEAVERQIAATVAPSASEVDRILSERARKYALPPSAKDEGHRLDIVGFSIGDDRYAVPLALGSAAAPLGSVTFVPGLPPFYLGLLNYRGGVFPVIDIRPLIGRPRDRAVPLAQAVLIRAGQSALALAATELTGIDSLPEREIALSDDEAATRRAIHGIGPGGMMILDAARLLQDIRLLVNEQPDIAIHISGEKI